MVKTKINNRKKEDAPQEAVLNLTIDGSFPDAQVRENIPAPVDAFQTPCSVNGVMAGISGGTLGYAFGFGKKTSCFASTLLIFPNDIAYNYPTSSSRLIYTIFVICSWLLV
jgi:hypothetical protein